MEVLRTRAAEELTGVLQAALDPMLTAGWELRGDPGHVVHLSHTTGKFTSMVDIVIEPYVWTYWNKDFGWGSRVGDMGILGSPTAGTYLPDKLPLPHPHMLADQPVETWITSVSLDALCAPVADGGIGAELDDLDITEAWVYPEQGRALDKWAKILREARKVAIDTNDTAMKRFLGAC